MSVNPYYTWYGCPNIVLVPPVNSVPHVENTNNQNTNALVPLYDIRQAAAVPQGNYVIGDGSVPFPSKNYFPYEPVRTVGNTNIPKTHSKYINHNNLVDLTSYKNGNTDKCKTVFDNSDCINKHYNTDSELQKMSYQENNCEITKPTKSSCQLNYISDDLSGASSNTNMASCTQYEAIEEKLKYLDNYDNPEIQVSQNISQHEPHCIKEKEKHTVANENTNLVINNDQLENSMGGKSKQKVSSTRPVNEVKRLKRSDTKEFKNTVINKSVNKSNKAKDNHKIKENSVFKKVKTLSTRHGHNQLEYDEVLHDQKSTVLQRYLAYQRFLRNYYESCNTDKNSFQLRQTIKRHENDKESKQKEKTSIKPSEQNKNKKIQKESIERRINNENPNKKTNCVVNEHYKSKTESIRKKYVIEKKKTTSQKKSTNSSLNENDCIKMKKECNENLIKHVQKVRSKYESMKKVNNNVMSSIANNNEETKTRLIRSSIQKNKQEINQKDDYTERNKIIDKIIKPSKRRSSKNDSDRRKESERKIIDRAKLNDKLMRYLKLKKKREKEEQLNIYLEREKIKEILKKKFRRHSGDKENKEDTAKYTRYLPERSTETKLLQTSRSSERTKLKTRNESSKYKRSQNLGQEKDVSLNKNSSMKSLPVTKASESSTRTVDVSEESKIQIVSKQRDDKIDLRSNKRDDEIDLRTVLTRKRIKNRDYITTSRSKRPKIAQRENLVITLKQEVNKPDDMTIASGEKRVRAKKSKGIKLVINIECPNSPESDDLGDGADVMPVTSPHQDLSFLDDINVDEIVDSLNLNKAPICESCANENLNEIDISKPKLELKPTTNVSHESNVTLKVDFRNSEVLGKTESEPISPKESSHDVAKPKAESTTKSHESHLILKEDLDYNKANVEVHLTDNAITRIIDQVSNHHDKPYLDTKVVSSNDKSDTANKMQENGNSHKNKVKNESILSQDKTDKKEVKEELLCNDDVYEVIDITNDENSNIILVEDDGIDLTVNDYEDDIERKLAFITQTESQEIKKILDPITTEVKNESKKISNIKCFNKTEVIEPSKTLENTKESKCESITAINIDVPHVKTDKNQSSTTEKIFKTEEKVDTDKKYIQSISEDIVKNESYGTSDIVENSDKIIQNDSNDKEVKKILNPTESLNNTLNTNTLHEVDNIIQQNVKQCIYVKEISKISDKQNIDSISTDQKANKGADTVQSKTNANKTPVTDPVAKKSCDVANDVSHNIPAQKNTAEPGSKSELVGNKSCNIAKTVQSHNVPAKENTSKPVDTQKSANNMPVAPATMIPNKQTAKIKTSPKIVSSTADKADWAHKDIINAASTNDEKPAETSESKGFLSLGYAININHMERLMSKHWNENYTITRYIHKGYFSNIFECRNKTGNIFALKVVKNKYNNSGLCTDAVMTDIQNSLSNNTEHILETIRLIDLSKQIYLLSDFYPKTLHEALVEHKIGFNLKTVKLLATQLIRAVETLTNLSIIHADINPRHILINNTNDSIKLCGFDRAHYEDNINIIPSTGVASYRAPEIILGFDATYGIDVWSTALVIYEMATGSKLLPGYYNNEILYRQQTMFGPINNDMLEQCEFKHLYFIEEGVFKRKLNKVKWVPVNFLPNIDMFKNSIYSFYKRRYPTCNGTKQRQIKMLYELLKEMLIMDPRYRLPIRYVELAEFFIY